MIPTKIPTKYIGSGRIVWEDLETLILENASVCKDLNLFWDNWEQYDSIVVRVVVFSCGRYNNMMNRFSLFGQLNFNLRH